MDLTAFHKRMLDMEGFIENRDIGLFADAQGPERIIKMEFLSWGLGDHGDDFFNGGVRILAEDAQSVVHAEHAAGNRAVLKCGQRALNEDFLSAELRGAVAEAAGTQGVGDENQVVFF